jgi:hypothetical protein
MLMLKPHDNVVRIPDHDHLPGRVMRPPLLNPQIEDVVQVNIRQQRRCHSPNAKGNFQFDRLIEGWRRQAVLDLRRKR